MMWGFGTSIGRYGSLRYICQLINETTFLPRLVAEHLAQSNIAQAYESLQGMRGIGSAFFTKYLYFAGRILQIDPCPRFLIHGCPIFLRG